MPETSPRYELVPREYDVMVGSEEIATVNRASSSDRPAKWAAMMTPDGAHPHAADGQWIFDSREDAAEAAVAEWQKRLRR